MVVGGGFIGLCGSGACALLKGRGTRREGSHEQDAGTHLSCVVYHHMTQMWAALAIAALGRLWRRLRELPLIAPVWTCGRTFQLKPHRHRYRGNGDFGPGAPGLLLVAPACARVGGGKKKSERLEKWVLK